MVQLRRIAAGDYETPDGRYRVYQLPGVYPPAWNVEQGDRLIVDGAATLRDARALLEVAERPPSRWGE